MMKWRREHRVSIAVLCCALCLSAAAALPPGAAQQSRRADPLEPARAALRTLQFNKAIALLTAAGSTGNADAQYLLGLIYLSGVGIVSDPARARALLQSAAEHGQGAAAYVLAGELARTRNAPDAAHQWLERSAKLGYVLAAEALKSGRPLLDRESVGAADPTLLTAWVIDCVRRNDAAELRRLGIAGAAIRDEFGRGPLSYAAAAGTVDAGAALLDLGADVHAVDKAGSSALMIAAERTDTAMIELLLRHGADPLAADAEQRTALFYAARANQPANLGVLRRAGAMLDARDERGYNALDEALAVGADAAVTELREMGLHANGVSGELKRRNGKFDPTRPGEIYRGWPPLALAVSRNDTASVQQLLGAGGDANLRLPQGEPLLQVAADAHAMESLKLLLAHGAVAVAADAAGHSALWLAATRNDLAVMSALLNAGVKPDAHAAAEQTPLFAVLRAAHAQDAAKMLLDAGAGPETPDAQGRTPLMLASASGQVELVKLLILHHARIGAEDHVRRTALWYAAACGSRDEVVALLSAGATQDADERGLTALHAAAGQKEPAVLAPLLGSDARINGRSAAGDTALLIAAATGHAEVVRALLAQKPDLDVQNKAGDTALIAASRGGYTGVCRMLVAAGADKSLRNGAGVSAGDIAASRGFASIAAELNGKG
jgi:uncharacterized protein